MYVIERLSVRSPARHAQPAYSSHHHTSIRVCRSTHMWCVSVFCLFECQTVHAGDMFT